MAWNVFDEFPDKYEAKNFLPDQNAQIEPASWQAAGTSQSVHGIAYASVVGSGDLLFEAEIMGLEPNSMGGLHIHYGYSCADEASVKGAAPTGANKGHYYIPADSTVVDSIEDPWSTVTWSSDGSGVARVTNVTLTSTQLGADAASAFDRVVIVHDSAGLKVGCGVLAAVDRQYAEIKYAAWQADGTSQSVSGIAWAAATENILTLTWRLQGLESNSGGGIHIHYGTSCDDEATVKGASPTGAYKGHYYVPGSNVTDSAEDPWSAVTWSSDGDGFTQSSHRNYNLHLQRTSMHAELLGADATSALDRVVIVHDSTGLKVGCGVLADLVSSAGSASVGVVFALAAVFIV